MPIKAKNCRWGTIFLAIFAAGCHTSQPLRDDAPIKAARADYQNLLEQFPEGSQGFGLDIGIGPRSLHPNDQPMTWGLLLSAEALHFKKAPNEECRRRIRLAARWLMENSDLDKDGLPGWGLPQAWDAFSDGTTNAPNTPYTITTAIVLNGFLDALSIPSFWTKAERQKMRALMQETILHWCRDLWSEGYGGGFFWYSPNRCDANFAVNSPAMFLGSMARLLREQGDGLSPKERRLALSRADDLARAIVHTAKLSANGLPYWDYMPLPNAYHRTSPNDLVHHIYTLWGIEVYRDCGGRVALPWTRAQAVESVAPFWDKAGIYSYPRNKPNGKSILWGAGIMLGFYAKWGDEQQAGRARDALIESYGPMPRLRLYPSPSTSDNKFYPRHAAHALYSLAYYCFTNSKILNDRSTILSTASENSGE